MKILIIEDDGLLQKGLHSALSQEGYVCEVTSNGYQAKQLMKSADFSLAILDLGLPDCDGLDLLALWRKEKSKMPILILTARDTVEDKITGLDSGADDYLVKPFALTELLARLRALIRRNEGHAENKIIYGSFELDIKQKTIAYQQKTLLLTPKEFSILARLIMKQGEQIHKDSFQNDLYDWNHDPNSNVLEVHIHSLRQKIGKESIRTIRGYGYQLVINK